MATDEKKSLGKAVRERIRANMDAQIAEQRRELFRKRLELARGGVDKYQSRDAAKSATNFHTYVRILEEYKGVPEGGLSPTHFDLKTEIAEILLLSGIYWDLVKLYDHTKSAERQKEFAHYLQQFIKFSKDMPHQHVSAETLRKYVSTARAIHKEELKNAYRILNKSRCFVVSELVEETEFATLLTLREYRDRVLASSKMGRALIRLYYFVGPSLAWFLGLSPGWLRRKFGRALDWVADRVAPT